MSDDAAGVGPVMQALEGLARWPHPPKNNCKKFLRSFVSCV